MNQKTILCYGDSNTWGYVPTADHSSAKSRYPRYVRWPGVLQTLLGEGYYVVEEGLNSRTTNLDYAPPPDRNGKNYLPPCLYSHAPIDLVVLALGGNDTKTYFNRTAEQIKEGLAELIDVIQTSVFGKNIQTAPSIILLTQVIPMPFVENYLDENGVAFMKGAVKKSEQMVGLSAQLAKEKNCYHLDLSNAVFPSNIDGVHYDELAHKICADLIYNKIIKLPLGE